MKKTHIIGAIIILVIVIGGLVILSGQNTVTDTQPVTQSTQSLSTSTPYIINLNPAKGSAGTAVTINGEGFDSTQNYITFGSTTGRHHPDGSADNVINTMASTDGKTLTFMVPSSGPSGILCTSTNSCIAISALRILPGVYTVTVMNKNGTSNLVPFTVTN